MSESNQTQENEQLNMNIEIVNDVPEKDIPYTKKSSSEKIEDNPEDGEELENYSNRVQKRIKKLKHDWHEERRVKEEAQRMREEAVNFAQVQQTENDKLRKLLTEGGQALSNVSKAKAEADLKSIEETLKSAYDEGDNNAIVEAQKKLAQLTFEKERLAHTNIPQWTPNPQSSNVKAAPQPQPRPQQPTDPKVTAWVSKNPWYQKQGYEQMTALAMGKHQELENSGVNARDNPDQYWSELDNRLREVFPDFFKEGSKEESKDANTYAGSTPKSYASVVAPSTRTTGSKGSRTVRLSKTAVDLAKKLGITNEQYAEQIRKLDT